MTINIDPVAFYLPLPFLGWWPVHWYGITWLLAIFGILWYSKKIVSKKTAFKKNDVEDFLFYGVLGAIIGGRLGYMLFYGFNQILINPLNIFKVWEGGSFVSRWIFRSSYFFLYVFQKLKSVFLIFQIILL